MACNVCACCLLLALLSLSFSDAILMLNLADLKKLPSREVDVCVIGAGIGGLSSAAILTQKYGMHTEVFESHYHAGGCAHSFKMRSRKRGSNAVFHFDSGPTIVLGCSNEPFNPLQQVINTVGARNDIDWIRYDSWGMVVKEEIYEKDGSGGNNNKNSGTSNTEGEGDWDRWPFELGPDKFDGEHGPLLRYGGEQAVKEFRQLRQACLPLCEGAANIPTMALRGGKYRLLPLLSHLDALKAVIPYADELNSNFEPLMEAHVTKGSWLWNWLDALAFSLSGLPASQTGAATMAYTLFDLHRSDSSLDYPRGGMGVVAEALVKAVEGKQGNNGQEGIEGEDGLGGVRGKGRVHLSCKVDRIVVEKGKAIGVVLQGTGEFVRARRGVLCNAPVWELPRLLRGQEQELTEEQCKAMLGKSLSKEQEQEKSSGDSLDFCDKKKTKSFLHLHLGVDVTGLDLGSMQPHFTVMHQGLSDPTADRNMVAVSNPSVLDDSLVTYTRAGEVAEVGGLNPDGRVHAVVHAYGAGNEDYDQWRRFKGLDDELGGDGENETNDRKGGGGARSRGYKSSLLKEYEQKKEKDALFLYDSAAAALGLTVKELKSRSEVSLIGSPLTHERFLGRSEGTYGSAWGSMLPGPETAIDRLFLCGDSVFPGIGVPAVAVSGANAANSLVSVGRHLLMLARQGKGKGE